MVQLLVVNCLLEQVDCRAALFFDGKKFFDYAAEGVE